jgi:outer membrane protein TolC
MEPVKILLACGAALVVMSGGCVMPPGAGIGALDRYQQALAERGPQKRVAQDGLDSLRPLPGTTGPALQIRKDPETGRSQLPLSLDEAIVRALTNNLDIRAVSFRPSISREEMEKAAAEFDYIVFGAFTYEKADKETASPLFPSMSLTRTYQAGIKNKTVTGATWSLSYTMTDTRDNATFQALNRRFEPTLALELTQPLLRDAWPGFNLARLDLARVDYGVSMAAFRQKVEETAAEVIATYWVLVQARRDLKIQQDLLDNTVTTLERVRARSELDATAVQIKQTEAAAESRRAALIRAHKVIQDVQDHLARLVNDAQINVVSDLEIVPITELISTQVRLDAADKLLTALRHNPVLEQARLAIDAADIAVRVAFNQALPRLDLTASTSLQGLDETANRAEESMETGNYASYGFGLTGEYPLGNRAGAAELRRQRLGRLKAITEMQNAADQVALDVRERIRQIDTVYREMEAQRAAVAAAKAQLKGLEDTERIRGQLTPEFLQVKLAAQEAVASGERAELQAIVQYNTALADLDRATGTMLEVHRLKVALVPATEGGYWPQPSAPAGVPAFHPSPKTGP